jgi:tetratricopeptide (TPR) repeat protein
MMYVKLNQMDKAGDTFEELIKLKPADPMAHYYLGMTLVSLKRHNEALPEFEATVANGGENIALAHRYLGGLYISSDKTKAADELEMYLKLDPKAPDADRIKGTIKDLRNKQ